MMKIYGRFWIKKDTKNYLGLGKIQLLEGISKTGSISQSAKKMYMSYKAAWDSVDAMNNISSVPLVSSATGGKGGGGTKITNEGKKAIEAYKALDSAKEAFCDYFNDIKSLDDLKIRADILREIIAEVDKK